MATNAREMIKSCSICALSFHGTCLLHCMIEALLIICHQLLYLYLFLSSSAYSSPGHQHYGACWGIRIWTFWCICITNHINHWLVVLLAALHLKWIQAAELPLKRCMQTKILKSSKSLSIPTILPVWLPHVTSHQYVVHIVQDLQPSALHSNSIWYPFLNFLLEETKKAFCFYNSTPTDYSL